MPVTVNHFGQIEAIQELFIHIITPVSSYSGVRDVKGRPNQVPEYMSS